MRRGVAERLKGDVMRSRNLETKERIKSYVEKFYLNNHRSPSSREVAEALDMVKSTVNRYLQAMQEEELKDWYDGYLFGSEEIYNPWSVINKRKKDRRIIK